VGGGIEGSFSERIRIRIGEQEKKWREAGGHHG